MSYLNEAYAANNKKRKYESDCCTDLNIRKALLKILKNVSTKNIATILGTVFPVYNVNNEFCCCMRICMIIPPILSDQDEYKLEYSECNCISIFDETIKNGIEEYDYQFRIEKVNDAECIV